MYSAKQIVAATHGLIIEILSLRKSEVSIDQISLKKYMNHKEIIDTMIPLLFFTARNRLFQNTVHVGPNERLSKGNNTIYPGKP